MVIAQAWPLHLELDPPHVAKDLSKPPPHSLIFSQVMLHTLPRPRCHTGAVISQVLIRFVLQRICLGRGGLQDRALQSLSSRRISECSMDTSGMHQHIPVTFSSGHPQERNKEQAFSQHGKACVHPDCVKTKID